MGIPTCTRGTTTRRSESRFRLAELLGRAEVLWERPVTLTRLAAWGRLNPSLLSQMRAGTVGMIDFRTGGTLCWIFGCRVADLVALNAHALRAPLQVARSAPQAAPDGLRLTSSIPLRVAAASTAQRAAMGLSRGTLHWLRKPDHQRVSLAILADLTRGLGVGINDLLEAPHRP